MGSDFKNCLKFERNKLLSHILKPSPSSEALGIKQIFTDSCYNTERTEDQDEKVLDHDMKRLRVFKEDILKRTQKSRSLLTSGPNVFMNTKEAAGPEGPPPHIRTKHLHGHKGSSWPRRTPASLTSKSSSPLRPNLVPHLPEFSSDASVTGLAPSL